MDENFRKSYDDGGYIGYFLELDIEYRRELQDLHSHLPFLPQKMDINKSNKFVCNLYDIKKLFCQCKITKTSTKTWSKTKKKFIKQLVFFKKHG